MTHDTRKSFTGVTYTLLFIFLTFFVYLVNCRAVSSCESSYFVDEDIEKALDSIDDPVKKIELHTEISRAHILVQQKLSNEMHSENAKEVIDDVLTNLKRVILEKSHINSDKGCIIFTVDYYVSDVVDALKSVYKEPIWAIEYYNKNDDLDNYFGLSRSWNYDGRIIMTWDIHRRIMGFDILQYVKEQNEKSFLDRILGNKLPLDEYRYIEQCRYLGYISHYEPEFGRDDHAEKLQKYLKEECHISEDLHYVCSFDSDS